MDDVTDSVFRRIIAGCAKPDLFFTEFVNVDGLQSPGRPRLLKKLQFTAAETPLIAQVWGKNPDNFFKTAQQIADGAFAREFGLPDGVNFAGIDLNMGCPVKDVVNHGCCSALINNRELAGEIINATQDGAGGKLPVSVKTRIGFNEIDFTWPEFLLQQKLNMLTIHGRTRKEMSKVPADWSAVGRIREMRDSLAPDTLIVGNGDVETRTQGLKLAEEHKLDGIMMGRGIFHDPYVFAEQSPWQNMASQQKIDLYTQHVKLFADTWGENTRPVHTLNKFCKIYINGFDGAKELREQLMTAQSSDALLDLLKSA
ncbi:MAG TPA: tRNA-dihydrouridine synthase [Candidatus Saccharimonadales bacterium]|nr:tRNA-dihydrouridine synthase [Candidatus Saccharimonadales bacterium]